MNKVQVKKLVLCSVYLLVFIVSLFLPIFGVIQMRNGRIREGSGYSIFEIITRESSFDGGFAFFILIWVALVLFSLVTMIISSFTHPFSNIYMPTALNETLKNSKARQRFGGVTASSIIIYSFCYWYPVIQVISQITATSSLDISIFSFADLVYFLLLGAVIVQTIFIVKTFNQEAKLIKSDPKYRETYNKVLKGIKTSGGANTKKGKNKNERYIRITEDEEL